MADLDLDGQVALVTGAGRGIGRAISVSLARAGARVGLVARSADELAATAALIDEAGGTARWVAADVTDQAALGGAFDEIRGKLGALDLLINNAGTGDPRGPFWEIDFDAWWRGVEINFRGVALATRIALPAMIARRSGRIVNIASDVAALPTTRNFGYASSKAAILRFTENLALATRPHGISVLAVSPGLVRTRLTEASWQRMQRGGAEASTAAASTPEQWSEPELVTQAILAIARGQADLLSGRYIHARKDDLGEMVRRVDEIRGDDLYTMKIRKLPPR